MGLRASLAALIGGKSYPFGSPRLVGTGLQFSDQQLPPGWNYANYLRAYGEIGTLFACTNIISQAVAKVDWHLWETDSQGERNEVFEHPVLDLLGHMNPFQTRYQFFYLATLYKLLVGEEFWQLNFRGDGTPGEVWLAPPQFMSVIPDPVDYIRGYQFRRTGMASPVDFTVEEIIHIKTPNPFNEYRGLSPAQALTVDLDTDRYAARWEQKFFFNSARPDFVIEYPPDQMPPTEIRRELMQEWDERHKGYRNSQKPAFLWGGKVNMLSLSAKDMDFAALRLRGRDAIMEAYHVPRSKLGITESVNRANAEQGDYDFQTNCVHPELCEIREALNKELVPLFDDSGKVKLDFDNPVPEDSAATVAKVVSLFKAQIITRNDALGMLDMDTLAGPEGEEYATASSPFGAQDGSAPPPAAEELAPQPTKLLTRGASQPFLAMSPTRKSIGKGTSGAWKRLNGPLSQP